MADTAVEQLGRTIDGVWGDWRGPVVEEQVFGTREPHAIASAIVDWAEAHLGARVSDVIWYHASVGCSAALTLVDGRRVVVKAHQPRFGATYLQAMTAVQQHLHECWFPCPEPVGPVAAVDGTESFATAALLRPGVPGESTPDLVDAAATLARLAIYLDGAEYIGINVSPLAPHPLQAIASGSLYPEPYSPAIRFDDTRALSWVDELAAAARTVVEADSTPMVVTHIDWCPRNVFGDSAGVSAVFDLDSLALLPEARAAGTAATAWALAHPGADGAVDRAVIDRFVWAHQRVRDFWFDEAAMRSVRAAVVWNLAYTARCEAALGTPSVATASLRSLGASLLA